MSRTWHFGAGSEWGTKNDSCPNGTQKEGAEGQGVAAGDQASELGWLPGYGRPLPRSQPATAVHLRGREDAGLFATENEVHQQQKETQGAH